MFVHVFQNAKYSSSKGGYSSTGASADGRYEGRMRDSPNGNSYSPAGGMGMGMGPERDSPRSYAAKPLYKKERENRDYKLSSSRDKYSGNYTFTLYFVIQEQILAFYMYIFVYFVFVLLIVQELKGNVMNKLLSLGS